ncbi:MAG: chemotaxis-specific protein-glutamate methyltransferase CheB [Spirochaetota bacterium]
MIKALVVEDSAVVREYLIHILNSDPEIIVIGSAVNGEEAIAFLKNTIPDVITMDIHMPRMDGFEATRRIMETTPVPIVIVSGSTNRSEVAITMQALEAGALTFIARPLGIGSPGYKEEAETFNKTVKLMSEIKVVHRWNSATKGRFTQAAGTDYRKPVDKKTIDAEIDMIAIGASTGGPIAIKKILSILPGTVPAPILIVQHISLGFVYGMADWLNRDSISSVSVASHGETVYPGHAYLAPDGFHMGITTEGRIILANGEPEYGLRPSVSFLFRSVLNSYGKRASGVLLTGMGKDGALELLQMRKNGCLTFAQNEASSVVNGMPGEAVRLDAADFVLSPEEIAVTLGKIVALKRRP